MFMLPFILKEFAANFSSLSLIEAYAEFISLFAVALISSVLPSRIEKSVLFEVKFSGFNFEYVGGITE